MSVDLRLVKMAHLLEDILAEMREISKIVHSLAETRPQ